MQPLLELLDHSKSIEMQEIIIKLFSIWTIWNDITLSDGNDSPPFPDFDFKDLASQLLAKLKSQSNVDSC